MIGKRILSLGLLATSLALATGCGLLGESRQDVLGKTLADLQPARLPDLGSAMPQVNIDEIEASYRRALETAESDELRRQILIRLAGLEMLRSEQEQLNANAPGQFFATTVDMYRELIELQEGRAGRDKLLYQLAKAYALDGRSDESARTLDQLAREYPQSPFIAEAQFRRAERAFSEGDYAAAEEHYADVVQAGQTSPFFVNAQYMQGWAQFKRNNYPQALGTFTAVLDGMAADDPALAKIKDGQRNMLVDTLRVMSLIFSYQDGPDSIAQTLEQMGERAYSHLLYESLGELYLEKKRYRDSANAFARYINLHPASDHAPTFSVRIIQLYDQADFPSLLLEAKENFVTTYGVHSEFWAQKPESMHTYLRGHSHSYLQELASFAHARAQENRKEREESKARQLYAQAAEWYEQFVATFPADAKTPEMQFLLGESRYESGDLIGAVEAYERVAFEWVDPHFGADAGYATILTSDEVLQTLANASDAAPRWRQRRIDNSLTFADYYPQDSRAPAVLARATQDLLNDGALEQAVAAAQRLSAWTSPLDSGLLKTAWLIQGQGRFDLQQYAESEQAYRQVLSLMPLQSTQSSQTKANANANGGPSRTEVVDRIAASMFKQAEQHLASDQKADAIAQLLRISAFAPESDIAASADYDAATYLMDMERWQEAQAQLNTFRRRYPSHALAASIPAKLVVVYQAVENWQGAAVELRRMADTDPDPQVRQQSLIMSAELFERSGDTDQAILAYRSYANTYSEPFAETLEAANKLVELYGAAGDDKRNFWLRKLITLDANAGSARSDRSRYLAASAASELAEQNYQHFAGLSLSLPLKSSLARKRKAMEETLSAYESVLDYGIADFATLANYRIGDVYVQLSRALLDSERPDNLNALELEQYQILLEEQAYPFEERAIAILEANARRSWDGLYDDWVKESFERLATLLPARYRKQEQVMDYSDAIQ